MKILKLMVVFVVALGTCNVFAEDKEMAASYAKGAAELANQGKFEKARDICYTALALDENCADALYQLGLLFERENKTVAAGDFLVRAAREFGKLEGADPTAVSKRKDAEMRVRKLNEFATRLSTLYADYCQDLNAATKKMTDTLTLDEACDRVDALGLRTVLPPDKGPKFERSVAVVKSPPSSDTKHTSKSIMRRPDDETVTEVPPDVERALKAAGWTKITGVWKKKADNVYEVTNGKLDAQMLDGAVQVIVQKGPATVRCFVRNNFTEYTGGYYATGFGFVVKGSSCKLYTPEGLTATTTEPYLEREVTLPEAYPKNKMMMVVNDSRLEFWLNEKSVRTTTYKLVKEGPFTIEVDGTAVIEMPAAKGR